MWLNHSHQDLTPRKRQANLKLYIQLSFAASRIPEDLPSSPRLQFCKIWSRISSQDRALHIFRSHLAVLFSVSKFSKKSRKYSRSLKIPRLRQIRNGLDRPGSIRTALDRLELGRTGPGRL